jgi:hypothetical protein
VLVTCIGTSPLGFVSIGLLAEAYGAAWATIITSLLGLTTVSLTRRYWRSILRE